MTEQISIDPSHQELSPQEASLEFELKNDKMFVVKAGEGVGDSDEIPDWMKDVSADGNTLHAAFSFGHDFEDSRDVLAIIENKGDFFAIGRELDEKGHEPARALPLQLNDQGMLSIELGSKEVESLTGDGTGIDGSLKIAVWSSPEGQAESGIKLAIVNTAGVSIKVIADNPGPRIHLEQQSDAFDDDDTIDTKEVADTAESLYDQPMTGEQLLAYADESNFDYENATEDERLLHGDVLQLALNFKAVLAQQKTAEQGLSVIEQLQASLNLDKAGITTANAVAADINHAAPRLQYRINTTMGFLNNLNNPLKQRVDAIFELNNSLAADQNNGAGFVAALRMAGEKAIAFSDAVTVAEEVANEFEHDRIARLNAAVSSAQFDTQEEQEAFVAMFEEEGGTVTGLIAGVSQSHESAEIAVKNIVENVDTIIQGARKDVQSLSYLQDSMVMRPEVVGREIDEFRNNLEMILLKAENIEYDQVKDQIEGDLRSLRLEAENLHARANTARKFAQDITTGDGTSG